jgi:hypothetical protein
MFNTPTQEPAASGHLPDPRPATGGVAAKWKALLFMAGVLFPFPLALIPVGMKGLPFTSLRPPELSCGWPIERAINARGA